MPKLLISTDLDGTLLDHYTYSTKPADPALKELKARGIPVVMNTSKTYKELLVLRDSLDNSDPFIVENGAAVFLPQSYSSTEDLPEMFGFKCKTFGPLRSEILTKLGEFKAKYHFTGFDDMSVEQVVEHTGLTIEGAESALDRQFTEPLIWQDTNAALEQFQSELQQSNLQLQKGGRFYHVMGKTDKAKAMLWLAEQYQSIYQDEVITVALGDGQNDAGMLRQANIPIIIKSPSHPLISLPERQDAWITEEYGPEGWAASINKLLTLFDTKTLYTSQH